MRSLKGLGLLFTLTLILGCSEQDAERDSTPPAAITDLQAFTGAGAGQVQLTWTAPGDDGTAGMASSYMVKFSTSSIDDANFDAASTYAQTWTPGAPGTMENRMLSGLVAGTAYFVAIKALDEVQNLSPLSNVCNALAGVGPDVTPPAAITDLAGALGVNPGEMDITWTAPGDDGNTGSAAAYVVKVSATAIDGSNFDSVPPFTQSWTPLAPGSTEAYTLDNLTPGQLYFVALKVLDEVPNSSAISNVVSALAQAGSAG
ncbi:MAG: hypothetical protein ACYTHN_21145, partial [Planctomycetota bacterium]